ncbi:TlpA family protein disulfide reductase [Maridesulfovibrio hydrothermalis]|uniref:Redoxin domain protein n=1 Tax=Maridesulfovibrio hydrothermalis AM13 = DSM 14728 TaxID=1121451 RepID=L0RAE1_9BACT|nr:TlpA disulfide reductase family protein [Maridesulfovibrio hydrothermalis]CCO23182.1 Redoxin domain protein [Maridesulfovibrio hydrothermalis AM13 = DSM 14728]
MKFFNKTSVIMALMLLFVVGCNKAETAQKGVENINAQAVQDLISNNKGKVVLVNFWATWCPPCRAEIPELVELRKKFSDDELVMIGVSVDAEPGAVTKFLADGNEFNYPVYFADQDVSSFFRIQSIPRTMLYDGNGKRVFDKEGSYPGAMFENYIKKLLKDR